MRDGHVVQLDIEFPRPELQRLADLQRHLVAHRQQLSGVVKSDDRLEHFIADGRQHALAVVDAKLREYARQIRHVGASENTERKINSLEIFGSRYCANRTRLRAYVHNECLVQSWYDEVRSLSHGLLLNAAAKALEDNSALASVNVIQAVRANESEQTGAGHQTAEITSESHDDEYLCVAARPSSPRKRRASRPNQSQQQNETTYEETMLTVSFVCLFVFVLFFVDLFCYCLFFFVCLSIGQFLVGHQTTRTHKHYIDSYTDIYPLLDVFWRF